MTTPGIRGRHGEELAWVAGFLRELSDIDRDVLVLHACGELSHLELAQALAVEAVSYTHLTLPTNREV